MKYIKILLVGLFITIKAYADAGAIELVLDEYMKANFHTKYMKPDVKLNQAAARKNVISLIILGELDSDTKIGQVDFDKQVFGYKDATDIDHEGGVINFIEVALFECTEFFLKNDQDFDWYKDVLKKAENTASAGNERYAEHIKSTIDIMQNSLDLSDIRKTDKVQYDEIKAIFEKILENEESNYFRGKLGNHMHSLEFYLENYCEFYNTNRPLFDKYSNENWNKKGMKTEIDFFDISEYNDINYFKNYIHCYSDFFKKNPIDSELALSERMSADSVDRVIKFYKQFVNLNKIRIDGIDHHGKFPINAVEKLVDVTKDLTGIRKLYVRANNKEQLKQIMQHANNLPKTDTLLLDISKDNSDKELNVKLPQVSNTILITMAVKTPLKIQAKEGSSVEWLYIDTEGEVSDLAIHKRHIKEIRKLALDNLKAKNFSYSFNFNMAKLQPFDNLVLDKQQLSDVINKAQTNFSNLSEDEVKIVVGALAKKLIDTSIWTNNKEYLKDHYKLDGLTISFAFTHKYLDDQEEHVAPYLGVEIFFSKDEF